MGGVTAPSLDSVPLPLAVSPQRKRIDDWYSGDYNNQQNNSVPVERRQTGCWLGRGRLPRQRKLPQWSEQQPTLQRLRVEELQP